MQETMQETMDQVTIATRDFIGFNFLNCFAGLLARNIPVKFYENRPSEI